MKMKDKKDYFDWTNKTYTDLRSGVVAAHALADKMDDKKSLDAVQVVNKSIDLLYKKMNKVWDALADAERKAKREMSKTAAVKVDTIINKQHGVVSKEFYGDTIHISDIKNAGADSIGVDLTSFESDTAREAFITDIMRPSMNSMEKIASNIEAYELTQNIVTNVMKND